MEQQPSLSNLFQAYHRFSSLCPGGIQLCSWRFIRSLNCLRKHWTSSESSDDFISWSWQLKPDLGSARIRTRNYFWPVQSGLRTSSDGNSPSFTECISLGNLRKRKRNCRCTAGPDKSLCHIPISLYEWIIPPWVRKLNIWKCPHRWGRAEMAPRFPIYSNLWWSDYKTGISTEFKGF